MRRATSDQKIDTYEPLAAIGVCGKLMESRKRELEAAAAQIGYGRYRLTIHCSASFSAEMLACRGKRRRRRKEARQACARSPGNSM
jgi:hypothetical protein